jgi:hypothetical protein
MMNQRRETMFTKRLLVSVLAGMLLGVVCIIGAQIRSGNERDTMYLFAFWFNRVLMGVLIGYVTVETTILKRVYRGALLGLLVSFAFYSATGFDDLMGFLVGAVYGVIIELVAYKLGTMKK